MYLVDMSRSPNTRIAVLGMAVVEPASGYAIRKSIASTIGHFWSESFGQIYPTLAALESEGLIEIVDSDGRRKVYGATDAGRNHLRGLLGSEFSQSPPRDETLLRLFFGRFLGIDGCRQLLADSKRENQRQLDYFADLRRTLERDFNGDPDLPFWLLTIRSGELAARAKLNWADEALASLETHGDECGEGGIRP